MIRTTEDDFWTLRSELDPPSPVRVVSAAGGLVVAAGASLHVLRPGSRRVRTRALPPGNDDVVAVAAEPWSPFRLAVATPAYVGLYTGHRPYDSVLDVGIPRPEFAVTHVAWGRRDGKPLLFMRHRNGEVQMVDPQNGNNGNLGVPRARAIAGDPSGVLAVIHLDPEEEDANVGDVRLLLVDAATWTTRWVDSCRPDEAKLRVHLAVHGAAVAYSLEPMHIDYCGSAYVSWEAENEDEDRSFESPPGVFMGPIAFQDERVVFAAYNVEGQVNVLRWERGGGLTRIARLGLDDEWKGTEATVTGIAWDDERRELWAASPELGLVALTEPATRRVERAPAVD